MFTYKGDKDFFGRPHGKGVVTFENGDRFNGEFRSEVGREGRGTLKINTENNNDHGFLYIDGVYSKDMLEGAAKIEYVNGDLLYAHFQRGVLHGLSKLFDKEKRLKRVAWYSNGRLIGTVWLFLVGGACITGEADPITGHLVGENIAYLYPDRKTALIGTYVKERFMFAQAAFIQTVAVRNEIGQVKFTQPRGPIYEFDPGTETRISAEPLLPDPYETQYCYVKTSRIKGAHDGLFAKRSLPKGFIVAFYNGIRLTRYIDAG